MRFLDHLPGQHRSERPPHPLVATKSDLAAAATAVAAAALPAVRRQSTNVINYPHFGENKWTKEGGATDVVGERFNIITVGSTQRYFDYRVLQVSAVAGTVQASHPTIVPVDLLQPYRVGVYAADASLGTINILLEAIDVNGDVLSTLTVTTAALLAAFADDTAEKASTINANGGGAPAWPNGTVGARVRIQSTNTATNKFVASIYLIQSQRLVNTQFTKLNATSGGGSHEAFWDGTNLFTISHTYGQMAKYDANLVRQAIVTTNSYPHDIVQIGADVWIVTYTGLSVQQINRSAMTVTSTTTINGNRHGFGIATDGTDLYIGIGDSGLAETPAIYKFTVSGLTQTLVSTDVNGGSANLPVVFQNGSIWSIVQANSQVKRINPVGGATIATITATIGGIYGLGGDGTLIYAQGEKGVVVVDPATNAVIATYLFSKQYGMGGNPRVDTFGRVWGCSRNGMWVLNQVTGVFSEIAGVFGGIKWTRPMANGTVAAGFYGMPSIDLY